MNLLKRTLRIFLANILCVWCVSVFAQERAVLNIEPSVSISDSQLVADLNTRGRDLRWTNRDSAFQLFRQAAELSREIGFLDGIGLSLSNMAVILMDSGRYEESLGLLQQALPYCLQATYYKLLPATLYNNMGNVYFARGAYSIAAYHYFNALKATGADSSSPIRISAYSNLGGIYIRLARPGRALQYFERGEQQARRQRDSFRLSFTLNNKGDALVILNEYDQALACYQEALQLARRFGQSDVEQAVETGLGELMLKLNKPKEAIEYLERALQRIAVTSDHVMTIQSRYHLGTAYYKIGDYERARAVLLPTIENAEQLGVLDNVAAAHETLAKVYEATGDLATALKHQRLYSEYRDSLLKRETTEVIHQLEAKYSTAQKDRELVENQLLIARQKHELQQKNTLIGIVSLAVLSLAILALFLWMMYRNNQQKQKLQAQLIRTMEKEKEVMAREEEIRLMQALIQGGENERTRIARELHDGIGGMLAAIQIHFSAARNRQDSTLQEQNLDEIMHMLENTADEVRKTAHNLMPDMLIKHSFEEALQLYCEQINASRALFVDLQMHTVIARLPKAVELSLYRIVQELVQNIIKHAEATHAIIQINQQEKDLIIIIEDNGKGFQPEQVSSGVGLQNLRSRVLALQGILSIESAPNAGTTVYMEFEIDKLNNSVTSSALTHPL